MFSIKLRQGFSWILPCQLYYGQGPRCQCFWWKSSLLSGHWDCESMHHDLRDETRCYPRCLSRDYLPCQDSLCLLQAIEQNTWCRISSWILSGNFWEQISWGPWICLYVLLIQWNVYELLYRRWRKVPLLPGVLRQQYGCGRCRCGSQLIPWAWHCNWGLWG